MRVEFRNVMFFEPWGLLPYLHPLLMPEDKDQNLDSLFSLLVSLCQYALEWKRWRRATRWIKVLPSDVANGLIAQGKLEMLDWQVTFDGQERGNNQLDHFPLVTD